MARPLRYGVVFPQNELQTPKAIAAFATAVADCGFDHLIAFDHILGADTTHRPDWRGHYDWRSPFQEPFVLFGYLAAMCELELVTGVLVLPQRQTALVAKQAATVDVLTGGRLRLGVGVGWNAVEYDALGISFRNRGQRLERQIATLRKLWTQPSVTDVCDHENIAQAGIAPLPVQRPIPLWVGSATIGGAVSQRPLRRAGRLADGFIAGPFLRPGDQLSRIKQEIRLGAEEVDRDLSEFGFEGILNPAHPDGVDIVSEHARWQEAGVTHLGLFTMQRGLNEAEHIDFVRTAAAKLRL